jgi:hypothetical protein
MVVARQAHRPGLMPRVSQLPQSPHFNVLASHRATSILPAPMLPIGNDEAIIERPRNEAWHERQERGGNVLLYGHDDDEGWSKC